GNLPSENRLHARHKVAIYNAHQEAKKAVGQIDREYGKLFGRSYGGLVEWYKADDAKYLAVCVGAWCSDAKEAVNLLRAKGVPVGLMRLRFIRPFPVEQIKRLDQYDVVIVYDRDITPIGGVLGVEIRSVLSKARVINIVAGIAGVDFDSNNFYETIQNAIYGRYGEVEFVI
ncbi:MAG: pyruvate ferredoxin oxidoreductase, partial [Pyrobaculum sp.]